MITLNIHGNIYPLTGADTVIHCQTMEQAKELFKELRAKGFEWCNGQELDDISLYDTWDNYGSETCYRIEIFDTDKTVTYGDRAYYKSYGSSFDVVAFDEVF